MASLMDVAMASLRSPPTLGGQQHLDLPAAPAARTLTTTTTMTTTTTGDPTTDAAVHPTMDATLGTPKLVVDPVMGTTLTMAMVGVMMAMATAPAFTRMLQSHDTRYSSRY